MSNEEKQPNAAEGQSELTAVVSCDDVFYDSKGREIKEFDVVKVFHFIGKRKKRHYMYKWIRKDIAGHLSLVHLTEDKGKCVPLKTVCKRTAAAFIWPDAEIVQSNDS